MKKFILIALIIIPYIAIGQTNKLFKQALKSTDLNEKIDLLSRVIDTEPTNLDAYFHRGIAKNDLGDYYGAIVDYSKIIVEKPDADTYFNRGNSRYSLGDLTSAKLDYKRAIIVDPNFIDALFSLGCANYDLKNYDKAIKDFNKVLEVEPYYSKAYILRAEIFQIHEKNKEALNDYSLAILVDPSVDTYYKRGLFFLSIDLYKNAKEDFTSATRLDYNNSYAYFYRGATQILLNRFKYALSDFSTALKIDNLDFDAMLGLAIAYHNLEDTMHSTEYFNKAKDLLNTNTIENQNIELFKNTYWYQNHYEMFYEMFKKTDKQ